MGMYERFTYSDYGSMNPFSGGAQSGPARFMSRRMRGPWGGSFLETTANIATFGAFGAVWSAGWGAMLAPFEIGHAAVQGLKMLERIGAAGPRSEFAGPVADTRMSYTMRQSALNAMHNSAYSLRGAIQNEAHLMHR